MLDKNGMTGKSANVDHVIVGRSDTHEGWTSKNLTQMK
jgi:hypothetical protein